MSNLGMRPRILYIQHTSKLNVGTSRSLLLQIRHLRSAFDFSVVLDDASGRLPEALKKDGIPCYILPTRTWRYLPLLVRLVIKGRYDLLYGNNLSGRSENGAWVAAITRRPFVWHIHEQMSERSPTRSFSLARAIIACSQDTADRVKRFAPHVSGKVITITNGIDLRQFDLSQAEARCKGRQALGIPLDSLVITNIGLVCLRKNQLDSLEAAAAVMKKYVHVHLCFLGEFGERAYASSLEQRAKDLRLAARVHWLGDRDDVPVCLCASDILLHTARKEAQGFVIREAMAARLPVVAYDVGGIHESVVHGETGFLAPFGDLSALVSALRRLVEHPELRMTMGANGYSRVRAHFTAEAAAGQVQQVITRLVRNSSGVAT
jgi:glycosyltransferase involved in cell wall biosynthesis